MEIAVIGQSKAAVGSTTPATYAHVPRTILPPLITLEVHTFVSVCKGAHEDSSVNEDVAVGVEKRDDAKNSCGGLGSVAQENVVNDDSSVSKTVEDVLLTRSVAARIPYIISALSSEWRPPSVTTGRGALVGETNRSDDPSSCRVQVFMPSGCSIAVLHALMARLAADADGGAQEQGLMLRWEATELMTALRLVQVASMLQIEELMPELIESVREAAVTTGDFQALETACQQLELPSGLREAAALARTRLSPVGLPDESQVRGMIASALLTADGKVWRVVQKVIDRREAWPHLAAENAAILLAFAKGTHGSIRATPHTGFFWGSRDFLYLVCRYIRRKPEHFDAMVSAMFDSLYNMDPELPAEIIDAVFKELLVHEGLSPAQCDYVITKLMQCEGQLEYLFHEWSGVFPALPSNARYALSKGLLPTVGRCPHAVLDFVLKELDTIPMPAGYRFNISVPLPLSNFWSRWWPTSHSLKHPCRRRGISHRESHASAIRQASERSEARVWFRSIVLIILVAVLLQMLNYVYLQPIGYGLPLSARDR